MELISLCSRTKAKFRKLKPRTFYSYRTTFSCGPILAVQVLLWEQNRRKEQLGFLTINCLQEQRILHNQIYDVLLMSSLSSDDEVLVDRESLARLAHRLMVSILCELLPVTSQVASLLETVMTIAMMTPERQV